MPDVVMPRLSDSMEEGTILRWLVESGTDVRRGDDLAEIETDKATMTFEADADGTFRAVAAEGDTVPLGAVIATIGDDGAEPAAEADRVKASPLARRIATERGVDLAELSGSGPGGRVVRADVEAGAPAAPAPPALPKVDVPAAAPAPSAPAPAAPAPALPVAEKGTAKGDVRIEELSRVQQTVARRMAESKAIVPEFALTTEVDMEAAVDLRTRLQAIADPAPSYNDMIVKAAAIALGEVPRANGAYRDGRFELYSRVNVGVAVAAKNALVVPTVFDADQKALGAIARETRALATRVRDGVITAAELSGGTFTVSNLGMYGVTAFEAIINAPQAGILAVGALQRLPRVVDDAIVPRHVLTLTLSCDHRILYGADAAQFLARIRALLEAPLGLAL